MSKTGCKIEFDGKIIFSKPLVLTESVSNIRDIIKDRVPASFVFLDQQKNIIDKADEADWKLEDIINGKIIQIQTEGNNSNILSDPTDSKGMNINICDGNKKICSINSNIKIKLDQIRKLISDKIKDEFIFIDPDNNDVEKNDEKDFSIEDMLQDDTINIKLKKVENVEKPKKKRNINFDFSKYKIIKKRDDLTIYLYSEKERVSNHQLVYQYFFDQFDGADFDNAYVVLFCGKTGDGKTTAINAFFNIIKGITLEDNYRFILIKEPEKQKGQAESQTDGVHLYYLKDYNNKPLIIIDSQGYGDTRGKKYDEMVNDAFAHVFGSIIDHINCACFISKSNNNRLDILTRYIFNSVTCLFSEDISENFIVLATFASRDTESEGPAFIDSIQKDADFLKIQDRLDEKWWFAFDSKCVLDNDSDKVTKYSFRQLKELYEEKVKKLKPKSVKKCAEVLETRKDLKVQVNLLSDTFERLLMQQANLQEKDKVINDISQKIDAMETKIKNFDEESKNLNDAQLEQRLRELNEDLNERLDNLNNETEIEYINSCEYAGDDYYYNHCNNCERNCHDYCDCFGKSLGRCTKFSWGTYGLIGEKNCEECHCSKDSHKIDHYRWTKKTRNKKKDNADKIEQEKQRNQQEKNRYLEEINRKKNAKSNLEKQINELSFNKNKLLEQKNNNIKDKHETEKLIQTISNQITFIIIRLKTISQKINDIAMNNNSLKTEDEYIDSLRDKMEEVGIKDEEQMKALKKMKENNRIFREVNKLNEKEIMKLDDSQLAQKLGVIIPQSKKIEKK